MAQDELKVAEIAAAVQEQELPWTAAENELTALSFEERQKTPRAHRYARGERADGRRDPAARGAGATTIPGWRLRCTRRRGLAQPAGNYVTPVKDQGGCGSCVSFCSCAVIESAVRIKLKNPSYAIDLSEGFLQFCGGGSCGGWGLTSGFAFAKSTGVTDEACMPYQATNMNCGPAGAATGKTG